MVVMFGLPLWLMFGKLAFWAIFTLAAQTVATVEAGWIAEFSPYAALRRL